MAGLYIHIPFCRHKCAYCDFFSSAGNIRDMDAYVNAIIKEFDLRNNELGNERIATLYIGGGTPSHLPKPLLEKLLSQIDKSIPLSCMNEVTLESNPEDISYDNIKAWTDMGIDRISVGIQSFNPVFLATIDRRHNPEASREALRILSSCNINYNADLIYGLPNQTIKDWKHDLAELLSYSPPHFSSYLLSYEPGTRLYARKEKGIVKEASGTTAENMFNILCEMADEAGYNHYEISNLALPGYEAKHNSAYWNYTPYIGLGTSAHSFDGTLRRFNPTGIKRYIDAISKGSTCYSIDDETIINRFNDYVITSLRTAKGFDLQFARSIFEDNVIDKFLENVTRFLKNGDIHSIYQSENTPSGFRISRNKWLMSDAILRELILE